MITVVQHPYGESDQQMANTTLNPTFEGMGAYIGYFSFKASEIAKGYLKFDGIPVAANDAEKSRVISTSSVQICGN